MGARQAWRSQSQRQLEQWIKEGKATVQELSMDPKVLRVEPSRFQSRLTTDPEHVHRLWEAMSAGISLPPVVVFFEPPRKYRLADGFHRHSAYRKAGIPSIPAYVIEGDESDAILYSVGANLENSKPTSREDRKKAVLMLLGNEKTRGLAATDIARRCGVNRVTVHKYRDNYFKEQGWELPADVECNVGGKPATRPRSLLHTPQPKYYVVPNPPPNHQASAYLCYRKKHRIYLGKDSPQAREKFESLSQAIVETESESERKNLKLKTNAPFVKWLGARGVLTETLPSCNREIFGIIGDGFVATVVPDLSRDKLLQAWGHIRAFRLSVEHDGRAVVVCYPLDGLATLIDLARRDGVEFMTPEEVVAEFGSKGTTDPGEAHN